MINTDYDYSSDHRFLIHPIKSITIVKVSTSEMQKEYKKQPKILLWEITLEFKFETTHLGLRRTTSEENKINANDRI